jgi:hypothetical protein
MNLDRRLLGWGVFFVILGAIPLAVRGGALDEGLVADWPRLWPLLLIAWGLDLLLQRTPAGWIGGSLAAVALGLMAGGALATGFGGLPSITGCGNGPGTAFATQSGTLGSGGQLNVEFTCGTVAINAVDGTTWSVAGTDPDGSGPVVTTSGSTLSIRPRDDVGVFGPQGRNDWTVSIPRTPALALGLTLNAGQATATLPGTMLSSVNLTVNAGTMTVDLGSAGSVGSVNTTVNAGTATVALPGGDASANLSLNAGTLTVCLPSAAPVRVHWSGTFGANDLGAAGLVQADNDTWTSSGFDASQPHSELDVSANLGSFHLQFGGSCGA